MKTVFLFCRRPLSYGKSALCLSLIFVFFVSCVPLRRHGEGQAPAPKGVKAEDISLAFDPPSAVAAWGETLFVQTEASLKSGQKYPVNLTVSSVPPGLSATLNPAILAPGQKGTLAISPALGEVRLGPTEINLEARAYGTERPREFPYSIEVVRSSGVLVQVLTAPQSQECRNACGRVSGSTGQLSVDFYDLILELGQKCDDKKPLPASQRINAISYSIGDDGFGFGRTCRVALVATPTSEYDLVNIRLPGAKVERGEVLLRLRSVQGVWLSPDNTVALVLSSGSLTPYDVLTGQVLGQACRVTGNFTGATLASGTLLTAASDRPCTWTIR
jgi:hypothetical protein